jgi:low affinity Fe/Cu permease
MSETISASGPREFFRRFAGRSSELLGTTESFFAALALILVWTALGPVFRYSDSWQLVINTTTSIMTFLMVFLIQNTQNRDAKATQLKLDELLRGVHGARTGLVRLEELSEEELKALTSDFERLRTRLAAAGEGPRGPNLKSIGSEDEIPAAAERDTPEMASRP